MGQTLFKDDEDNPLQVRGDAESKSMFTGNWVWNPDSLQWNRMIQPSLILNGNISASFEALETIMNRLLKEQIKTNLYLAMQADEEVSDDDVEV